MEQVEAMDFYERVVGGDTETREITLENEDGAVLDVELTVVERKELLDEINRLPDEMLETLSEAEDPEEAEEAAREQNMMSNVNGDTIQAFENICTHSIEHEELTSFHVEEIVSELDFEVLFPLGAEVIEMSFESTGKVKDFHGLDSAKN